MGTPFVPKNARLNGGHHLLSQVLKSHHDREIEHSRLLHVLPTRLLQRLQRRLAHRKLDLRENPAIFHSATFHPSIHLFSKGDCVTGEQKMNDKLKRLNLDAKTLLTMSDEDIKRYFKSAGAILNLKAQVHETNKLSELEMLLKKYLKCPQCKAYIEKIDG